MKRILEEVLKEQRGRGQGVGGPRQGDGGAIVPAAGIRKSIAREACLATR